MLKITKGKTILREDRYHGIAIGDVIHRDPLYVLKLHKEKIININKTLLTRCLERMKQLRINYEL